MGKGARALEKSGPWAVVDGVDADVEAGELARGIVTLPCGEREASAAQELSGCCERGPPRVHRRGAKHAVRLG